MNTTYEGTDARAALRKGSIPLGTQVKFRRTNMNMERGVITDGDNSFDTCISGKHDSSVEYIEIIPPKVEHCQITVIKGDRKKQLEGIADHIDELLEKHSTVIAEDVRHRTKGYAEQLRIIADEFPLKSKAKKTKRGEPGDLMVDTDPEKSLYIATHGDGTVTMGFDECLQELNALQGWACTQHTMKVDAELLVYIGVRGEIQTYLNLLYLRAACAAYCGETIAQRAKLQCPIKLTPQLMGLEGKTVDVVDAKGDRRRFKVSKSTGWCPTHLECKGKFDNEVAHGTPYQEVQVVG